MTRTYIHTYIHVNGIKGKGKVKSLKVIKAVNMFNNKINISVSWAAIKIFLFTRTWTRVAQWWHGRVADTGPAHSYGLPRATGNSASVKSQSVAIICHRLPARSIHWPPNCFSKALTLIFSNQQSASWWKPTHNSKPIILVTCPMRWTTNPTWWQGIKKSNQCDTSQRSISI